MAKLTIISTPIGNMGDITKRSVDVLSEAQIILCEDTRVTSKLLRLLGINHKDKKLLPYFEYNERSKYKKAIELLQNGNDLVLVSDAGSPLLSDPGFRLVREIREKHDQSIQIEVLPGPSAITTAVVASGLPTDKFTFLGFVPRKPSDRKKLFKHIRKSSQHLRTTYIMFETMQRLLPTLETMAIVLKKDDIQVALCAELTKQYERVLLDSLENHISNIRNKTYILKGELAIVFNLG